MGKLFQRWDSMESEQIRVSTLIFWLAGSVLWGTMILFFYFCLCGAE